MPVIGAIPIVMPTLTKIWKRSATTIPPATIAEEEVARDGHDAQAAPEHQQIEAEQERRPDEPPLLREAREGEVGLALGEEAEGNLRRPVGAAARVPGPSRSPRATAGGCTSRRPSRWTGA